MADSLFNATSTVQPRSARTIAVDNFLRKALRVSDPRDPAQIAAALLMRYPVDAERERREQEGLAYSTLPDWNGPTAMASGPFSVEVAQARDDLDRDLQTLVGASQFKDLRVELSGWSRAIRQIAADGLASARLALDVVSHNRAMAARRGLSDYARLARYLGSLTDNSNVFFRSLAQSCDVLAGLILVAIGEAMAAAGFTRSTAIVRVAAGELQARRNAVITALRSLTGSVESALGQEEWPRGLEAYRSLVQRLDSGGQADLRTLIEETSLAQAMDELVDLSTGANVEGLRELATTSSLLVRRFQRLIQYGQSVEVPIDAPIIDGPPESPPLVAFISSLQLFVDAFTNWGGSRLLHVARPPIIVYGLYGVGGPDRASVRLINLTVQRGLILEQIDCFANCGCDEATVRCQILLDFILFSIDRAIDSYAVGTDPDGVGEPERRAAAAGLLILQALALPEPQGQGPFCGFNPALAGALRQIAILLIEPFGGNDPGAMQFDGRTVRDMVRELRTAYHAELQTERLVRSLSPSCHAVGLFDFAGNESLIRSLLRLVLNDLGAGVGNEGQVQMPSPVASSMASMAQNRPDYWSA